MKVSPHFLTSKWQLAISTNGQWAAQTYSMIIGNVCNLSELRLVTDIATSALNKLDNLESAECLDTIQWERRELSGDRLTVTIAREDLEMLMDFCHDDDTRYYANGILVRQDCAVASDALTLCKLDVDGIGEGEAIVPRLFLKAMLKAAPKSAKEIEITVYPDQDYVVACMGNILGESKTIAGQFPTFDAAFPKQVNIISEAKWTKESDVALARAPKNKMIHAIAVESLLDAHYNGVLLKKVLKHSTGKMELEALERPAMLTSKNGKARLLIVPQRS